MNKVFNSKDLAKFIDGKCSEDNIEIENFSSLKTATQKSVSFFYDRKYLDDLKKTKAAVVILNKKDLDLRDGPYILVNDPYLAFAKASSFFIQTEKSYFIHNTAIVSPDSKVANNVSLSANVFIGTGCMIHDEAVIGENSVIGNNVNIGKNTIIHSNVSISSNVTIGANCEIFSGAVIGSDGFGYAKDKSGSWVKIPQIGSVLIGNNVHIGANTTIDRGAIDNTVIDNGVKIDNLVQIGHNCYIGQNTIIAGCAGIAGSTIIGKNCMIGGAAMIKGHITIADDTIISGGTGIGRNIECSGKRFTNVFPYNLEHKEWLRIASNLKKIGKTNE